jgi:ATP-binding protein involved in chromosome partitioning
MTQDITLDAVLAPIAGTRATARIEGDRASIILDVTGLAPAAADAMEAAVRVAVLRVPGIATVRIAQTAERAASERTMRRIIAVASGKGGVGKSTVASNLALGLYALGRRVGLVDADIYGPSQPKLMGVEGTRPEATDKLLDPVPTPHGIGLLSIGQLVPPDQAIAWRGPMAANALTQLIVANWHDVDTLVIDLPPGTGDVQLTMVQKHKPAGAVIVSTPQDLSLIDAKRAIDFFVKAGVPIIGLIENMAGYACPHCGEISDPFGRGGAEAAAAQLGIPFLGRIPLDIAIRTASDAGNAAEVGAFGQVATHVDAWMNTARSS